MPKDSTDTPISTYKRGSTGSQTTSKCTYANCNFTASTRRKVRDHENKTHKSQRRLQCPYQGCYFDCADAMVIDRHYQMKHGGSGSPAELSNLRFNVAGVPKVQVNASASTSPAPSVAPAAAFLRKPTAVYSSTPAAASSNIRRGVVSHSDLRKQTASTHKVKSSDSDEEFIIDIRQPSRARSVSFLPAPSVVYKTEQSSHADNGDKPDDLFWDAGYERYLKARFMKKRFGHGNGFHLFFLF